MFRKVLIGVLCLAVVSGAFAQPSATSKGSLLVFPKVEVRWDLRGNVLQDTFISVNNDNSQEVHVKLFYVNKNCTKMDNGFVITANQPIYWSALTGDPKGLWPWPVLGDPELDPEDPTQLMLTGYVLIWAVDLSDVQINWNHLYGTATTVNYALNTAWEYNAYAFPAIAGTQGGKVGADDYVINLNGIDYASGFKYLQLDFYTVGALAFSGDSRWVVHDTDLTLLILDQDLRQETTGPFTTKAVFEIWNTAEIKFTGTEWCFTKFNEGLLSRRHQNFFCSYLNSDKARAKISSMASPTVCGALTNSAAYSLLGVQKKVLTFLTPAGAYVGTAYTGGPLVGSDTRTAKIQYDGPPKARTGKARPAIGAGVTANAIAN